jgi:hypothetical protein
LGTRPGGGRTRNTIAAGLCALGLLGGGALSAEAQVTLPSPPSLPPAPKVPLPVPVPNVPSVPAAPAPPPVPAPPTVEAPSLPQVAVPGPVQRALPPVGGPAGASGGGAGGGPVAGTQEGTGVAGTGGSSTGAGGSGTGAAATGGSAAAASGSVAGASASAPGSAGLRAAGTRPGSRQSRGARERATRRRAIERRRERLVRRLSGCVDALPRMQRTTLILRYGIGPLPARSGGETARLLDLPRGRVRLLERRGLRAVAGLGRATPCEESGISRTSLVEAYELLSAGSSADESPPALAAGLRLANAAAVALDGGAAAVALDRGAGAVAGARESGEERRSPSYEPGEDGPVSSAGPSLGDPFGDEDGPLDNPLLLVLLAIVVATLASAAGQIRRALR